jgi:hypothetical protein
VGRQDRSTPRGFRALIALLDVLARVQRSKRSQTAQRNYLGSKGGGKEGFVIPVCPLQLVISEADPTGTPLFLLLSHQQAPPGPALQDSTTSALSRNSP